LLTLLGGVAGGIVGGFLSKRGEIAAIQSQIGTVLSQNERIVESTERIKRQLTEETWAKQRHWELKRDTAIEIMRLFGSLLEGSRNVFEAAIKKRQADAGGDPDSKAKASKQYEDSYVHFAAAMTMYWQQEEIAKLVFSAPISEKIGVLKRKFQALVAEYYQAGGMSPRSEALYVELQAAKEELAKALRLELQIP